MRSRLFHAIVIAGASLTGGCSSQPSVDASTPKDGGPIDFSAGHDGNTPIGSGDLGLSPIDANTDGTAGDGGTPDGGKGDGATDAGHPIGLGPIDAGLSPIDGAVGLGPRDA